jgi:hypothetical protein
MRSSQNNFERIKTMKYAKPEISLLGDAASVIQGQVKHVPGSTDFTLPPPRPMNYVPAYDLDE